MIFATIGTQAPFDRFIKILDEIAPMSNELIIAQTYKGRYQPKNIKTIDFLAPDEFDKNEWTVEGEPNTTLVINRPSTVELTCASIVNRIPDVINSKPGYVPTEEFGELNYRTKPLNEYVK